MTEGAQVVGGGQARAGPEAGDADPLAAVRRDLGFRVAAVGEAVLGRLGLHRPDKHGAVAAAAKAGRFARRGADQATGQRQRVVTPHDLDRRPVVTMADVSDELRDVDVGRARAAAHGAEPAARSTAPPGQDSRRACCFPLLAVVAASELPSGQAAASPWAPSSSATSSRARRWAASPRPSVSSATRPAGPGRAGGAPDRLRRCRRAANAGRAPGASGAARHAPSAITISVDGTGMTPAEASDSGWHDTSAADSGRKPPRPSSKTSTGSWPVHPDAAAPAVDLLPQAAVQAGQLDQAALLHAPPQRQQRRLQARSRGEQEGDPAPGLRGVDEP